MKQTVLRYGTYSALFLLGFFILTWLVWGNSVEKDFKTQEVMGYVAIFLATSFAFFGIKHYRDRVCNGTISFGKALKVGLMIVLLGAFAFALIDTLYIVFINPEFYDSYFNYQVSQMKSTIPAKELEEKLAEMEQQKELLRNPAVAFFVMFLTVVAIGLIVSVLSAFILKRKEPKTS